jgi:exopolysaccharide production protein ExoZ
MRPRLYDKQCLWMAFGLGWVGWPCRRNDGGAAAGKQAVVREERVSAQRGKSCVCEQGGRLEARVDRFESLHYTRGAAALMVVLFHALVNSRQPGVGFAGVDIFFVLSGFLMWKIGRDSRPSLFLMKRALRIVPLYWLATSIIFMFAEFGFTNRVKPDLGHLVSSLLFVPYATDYGVFPLLQVGWTLNYEVAFYLVFALTLSTRYQAETITGLFVALSILHPWATGTVATFFTDPIILEFVAGIWLARAHRFLPARIDVGLALVGFGLVYALTPDSSHTLLGRATCAVAIVAGGLIVERSGRLPRIPALAFLGEASYSIYLFHLFAVGALFKYHPGAPALFAASVVAGIGGYYLFERPLLQLTRLARQRQAEPEPA